MPVAGGVLCRVIPAVLLMASARSSLESLIPLTPFIWPPLVAHTVPRVAKSSGACKGSRKRVTLLDVFMA
ncbi:hypothetical protein NDU88_000953 [Pleurodeles waltl]|uniref:Secreted protein n=1 Tax=Pleurodeles waltl TaxID=8319 RepID=A0AAV7RBF3_PLEWA|nr:hypothetical protein NDU88_000953 [Pleurodeles waltl]